MQRFIKEYLTFNSRERLAIVFLICLIVFFWMLPNFFSEKQTLPVVNFELASQKGTINEDSFAPSPHLKEIPNARPLNSKPELSFEPFYFDPNTIDELGWKKLGIADKTIQTIMHYRIKGGKFRQAQDLEKIWGMPKNQALRLIPYVQIKAVVEPNYRSERATNTPVPSLTIAKQLQPFDVNIATVEEWKALPGIGDVLAARIIRYRDKIGGFRSMEQLKKTYGISDSVFQLILPFLRINEINQPKININTASIETLLHCSAISPDIARAIIAYRQQYGAYTEVNDLKKILFITEAQLNLMRSSLVVQ